MNVVELIGSRAVLPFPRVNNLLGNTSVQRGKGRGIGGCRPIRVKLSTLLSRFQSPSP